MKYILYSSLLFLLLSAGTVLADGPVQVRTETVTLENPLAGRGINSIEGLLVALLNILMVIMVPVIVFYIILAGFKYVTARGNSTKVGEATQALTYAVIGAVLILGAWALSGIIKDTVDQFQS